MFFCINAQYNSHIAGRAGGPERIGGDEGHVGRHPSGPNDGAGKLRAYAGREQLRARQRRRVLGERRRVEEERVFFFKYTWRSKK